MFPDDDRSRHLQVTKDPARFSRMADYIDVSLNKDLRLEEIALQVGVSIRHMSRIFKAATALRRTNTLYGEGWTARPK